MLPFSVISPFSIVPSGRGRTACREEAGCPNSMEINKIQTEKEIKPGKKKEIHSGKGMLEHMGFMSYIFAMCVCVAFK